MKALAFPEQVTLQVGKLDWMVNDEPQVTCNGSLLYVIWISRKTSRLYQTQTIYTNN